MTAPDYEILHDIYPCASKASKAAKRSARPGETRGEGLVNDHRCCAVSSIAAALADVTASCQRLDEQATATCDPILRRAHKDMEDLRMAMERALPFVRPDSHSGAAVLLMLALADADLLKVGAIGESEEAVYRRIARCLYGVAGFLRRQAEARGETMPWMGVLRDFYMSNRRDPTRAVDE